MAPQMRIRSMGLSFNRLSPKKAKRKRRMLMVNCNGLVVGEPKLVRFINRRAAEAKRPTTTGRMMLKTISTEGCLR